MNMFKKAWLNTYRPQGYSYLAIKTFAQINSHLREQTDREYIKDKAHIRKSSTYISTFLGLPARWSEMNSWTVIKAPISIPFNFALNTIKLLTEFLPAWGIGALAKKAVEKKNSHSLAQYRLYKTGEMLLRGLRFITRAITSPILNIKDTYCYVNDKIKHPLAKKVIGVGLGIVSALITSTVYLLALPFIFKPLSVVLGKTALAHSPAFTAIHGAFSSIGSAFFKLSFVGKLFGTGIASAAALGTAMIAAPGATIVAASKSAAEIAEKDKAYNSKLKQGSYIYEEPKPDSSYSSSDEENFQDISDNTNSPKNFSEANSEIPEQIIYIKETPAQVSELRANSIFKTNLYWHKQVENQLKNENIEMQNPPARKKP